MVAHNISMNDVFDVLCMRTNAMVVESLHPYKNGMSHIVELTPTDEEGKVESGKHGLTICFDEYCDIRSGNAEIRFFTDKSCRQQVGEGVYLSDNLPTMRNPLFVNSTSVVMLFKSRNLDETRVYYGSWGWKMCIVKAQSLDDFKEVVLREAVQAATLKTVLCGTTKSPGESTAGEARVCAISGARILVPF